MICVHLRSKFRWWRILYPGVHDFPLLVQKCVWFQSNVFILPSLIRLYRTLGFGFLRWTGCPESAVGMLSRHCALWQSGCCRLLLKQQHSSVMISVKRNEWKRTFNKSLFYSKVFEIFLDTESGSQSFIWRPLGGDIQYVCGAELKSALAMNHQEYSVIIYLIKTQPFSLLCSSAFCQSCVQRVDQAADPTVELNSHACIIDKQLIIFCLAHIKLHAP